MAERAVGMAKSTLSHQLDGNKSLDFAQMEALLLKVSHILNSRPIGARVLTEDDFHPVSRNDLLLGCATRKRETWETEIPDQAVDPSKTLVAEEELCERWWAEWSRIAFPLLVPRGRWATQHHNLDEVWKLEQVVLPWIQIRRSEVIYIKAGRKSPCRTSSTS